MNMSHKTVWISAPVQAKMRRPRTREALPHMRRLEIPIKIETVSSESAPIALTAYFDDIPDGMSWRLFDNALWRPLIGMDRLPMLEGAEALQNRPRDRAWLQQRGVHQSWNENPFGIAFGGKALNSYPDPISLSLLDEDDGYHRISDRRSEVIAEVSRIAADDLLEIGGVLHKRSVPPVWAVGLHSRLPLWVQGVGLCMLDNFPFEQGFAHYRFSERDRAIACFDHLRETSERYRRAWGEERPAEDPVISGGRVDVFIDLPEEPDYRVSSLKAVLGHLTYAIEEAALKELPYGLLRGYVQFTEAISAMGRCDSNNTLMEDAVAACKDMIAAVGDDIWHTWPRIADGVGALEAVISRHALDHPENADDEALDIGAIRM